MIHGEEEEPSIKSMPRLYLFTKRMGYVVYVLAIMISGIWLLELQPSGVADYIIIFVISAIVSSFLVIPILWTVAKCEVSACLSKKVNVGV